MMQQKAQRQAFAGVAVNPASAKLSPKSRARLSAKAQAVAAPTLSKEMVDKCVNTIRFVAIDAVNKSKSGHPGMPMGCAPMGYVLWNETMKYNPKNPAWVNRDRFVLSAGHGSMFQYAMLHLTGYDSVSVSRFASIKVVPCSDHHPDFADGRHQVLQAVGLADPWPPRELHHQGS